MESRSLRCKHNVSLPARLPWKLLVRVNFRLLDVPTQIYLNRAQVMMMVGIKPVPDALGRVNKLEVIPLEELGRPRIDVVVNCSGVFRDLFVNQMLLLDRAVKMAAELDEPDEMNFVRKHARQQAEELGLQSVREAATRIFSNSSGSYSSNVNLAVENSSWTDEAQVPVALSSTHPSTLPHILLQSYCSSRRCT